MPSASAVLQLVRWPNALIAAAGVLLGAWWGSGHLGWRSGVAALAAIALAAAANAWNDVADVAIDARAHPERPLPSGRLSVAGAARIARTMGAAALPLAALARPALGLLTIPVLALMRLYSPHLKRRGLPGNIVVAVLASLPFLYGAWAEGAPGAGLRLVAIAAPLHFAREIAKDLDDAAGDAGARATLALRAPGVARGALVCAVLLFVALLAPVALPVPHFALALVPAIFVCGL
ncbi:MAG TPA: UbiA family prenyltransferase, partial [Gemmatimonadaceae bacterium]|nr:UbiA family prenyltransferase [Gemmatimonadaceae bacterium]